MLLPLGPDTVRRFLLRRTHPAVALKDTSGVMDCQLPSRFRRIALVITIVNNTIAPIVIPNVVFPGFNKPGTGEFGLNSELISVEAAARVVQRKRMIKKTIT